MRLGITVKHAWFELTSILRHPEQLLLILGTPVGALYFLKSEDSALTFAIASCALASSFTSVAINTGFARRYGTLKYLAVTPLGLNGLIAGQALVGVFLLLLQIPVALLTAILIGAKLDMPIIAFCVLPLLALLFTQLAYLFASLLSAEKVLALANLVFIAFLASGIAMIQNKFSFAHPLAGLSTVTDALSAYLLSIVVANLGLAALMRKYFRWLD